MFSKCPNSPRPPQTPCWLSRRQRVMKCPNWVRPVILTLGSLDPQRSIRASYALCHTSKISNVCHVFLSDEVAHISSGHEPLPRRVKASSFCLSFECTVTPVSSLWACWLFPRIRRLDWHFLCFDSQKWRKVLSVVYLVKKDVFQTS